MMMIHNPSALKPVAEAWRPGIAHVYDGKADTQSSN
jgi:hypothetical protein